jgi:hypothetical protein
MHKLRSYAPPVDRALSIQDREQSLRAAAEEVLTPLARVCVAQGLPFAQAEELFKRAYVRAARDARRAAGAPASRDVSQVSVTTGISRREVTRLTAELLPRAAQRPSPATQVFLRWISERKLRGRDGTPRPLPRQGPAPSFEALALSVTRHVHPRSLLDELCRLGLAELDADGATVRLIQSRFVPEDDDERLHAFLGANVGDHLAAAADNVIHRDRRHFEQALFTDELSEPAAATLRTLAQGAWKQLVATLVPAIEKLIADDKAHGRRATRRGRIGLFSYHDALPENDDEAQPSPRATPR